MEKHSQILWLLVINIVFISSSQPCWHMGMCLKTNSRNYSNEDILSLPSGKLPWPHQKPGISQDEFDALINGLWILDNFGTYHAVEGKYLYFHDGLDIMLDNGTEIYAIESGYVKSLKEDPSGGGCINIGDTPGESPGYGWEYAHTGNFRVNVGDYVYKGDLIAEVVTREHVHLSRIRVMHGSWADKRNLDYLQPLTYFVFKDTIPPELITPFFYFHNESDVYFERRNPTVVSGEVDIVVPMRDLADCMLRSSLRRWCVGRIEYEIKSVKNQKVYNWKSFDFTKIIFADWPGEMYDERVLAIYKPDYLPILKNSGIDSRNFAFYIVTNMEGSKECCDSYELYRENAWNTAALDEDGMPLFPDGDYIITVKAIDIAGNSASASDVVRVRNNPQSSRDVNYGDFYQ